MYLIHIYVCVICYNVANVENSIKPIHLSRIMVHNSLFFKNAFQIVGIQIRNIFTFFNVVLIYCQ